MSARLALRSAVLTALTPVSENGQAVHLFPLEKPCAEGEALRLRGEDQRTQLTPVKWLSHLPAVRAILVEALVV